MSNLLRTAVVLLSVVAILSACMPEESRTYAVLDIDCDSDPVTRRIINYAADTCLRTGNGMNRAECEDHIKWDACPVVPWKVTEIRQGWLWMSTPWKESRRILAEPTTKESK